MRRFWFFQVIHLFLVSGTILPIDFWFDPDFGEFNPLIHVENEPQESDVILLMMDDTEIISEQETLTLSPLPIFEEDIKGHIKEMYLYSSQEYKRSRELRGKLFRFFFAVSDDDEPVINEPWAVLHFPQWQPRYWAARWVWQWGLYEWLEYSNDLYDVWITACDWKMDVTKVEPNIWEIDLWGVVAYGGMKLMINALVGILLIAINIFMYDVVETHDHIWLYMGEPNIHLVVYLWAEMILHLYRILI